MATKLTSTGVVTVKNVGKDPIGDSVGVGVKLTAKKTTNGITYLFTATEQTIHNLKSIFGEVSITRPARLDFCTLEGTLTYNLNQQALTSTLIANKKSRGREIELKAQWAEMTGRWDLGASVKPRPNHKLVATLNPHTKAAVATYTLDWRGWTLQPALNVQKRAPALALSKKLPRARGTVKATHALQDGATTLSWSRKPATIALATKVNNGKVAHPNLSLTLEQDFTSIPSILPRRRQRTAPAGSSTAPADTSTAPVAKSTRPADKSTRPAETPAPPAPTPEGSTLAERLSRLTAAYDAEFARLGKRGENGIETLSYKR